MKHDVNGYKLHRSGKKIWINSAGQRHRTNGPAVEYADSDEEFWYKGKLIAEEVFHSDEFQVRMVMEL